MLIALCYGLSLTNHVSGILFEPGFIWIVVKQRSIRQLLRLAPLLLVMFIAGLAIYIYLPLRDMANPQLNYVRSYYGIDLKTPYGVWWMISGQAYRFFAFGYDFADYLREMISTGHRLWRNFTGVGVILGLIGPFCLIRQRQRFAIRMIISLVLVYGFYSGYAVADKGTMFLPVYVIWAILAAAGAQNAFSFARKFSIIRPKGTLKLGILFKECLQVLR